MDDFSSTRGLAGSSPSLLFAHTLWGLILWMGLCLGCREPSKPETKEPDGPSVPVTSYHLDYRMESEADEKVRDTAPLSDGVIHWRGLIEVWDLARDDAGSHHQLRFIDPEVAELELMDQVVPLEHWRDIEPVAFQRDPTGEAVRVRFTDAHDLALQALVSDVLSEGLPRLPPPGKAQWTADARNLMGRSSVRWVVERLASGNQVATRTRLAYETHDGVGKPKVDSIFRYTLNDHGQIVSMAGQEVMHQSTEAGDSTRNLSIALETRSHRVEQESDHPDLGPSFVEASVPLGDTYTTERARRLILEQQAGSTTVSDILGYASVFGILGRAKDHNERFWSSVGLLRLKPETISPVEQKAKDARTPAKTRGYLMDVLAGAGTRPAQLALIRVVNSTTTRAATELIQAGTVTRLSFVEAPQPELVEAAHHWYERHGNEVTPLGEAVTLTLGTVVGRARAVPESRDVAKRMHEQILSALRTSPHPELVRHHIKALGAVGYAPDLITFRAASTSTVPRIRAAVATSLVEFPDSNKESVLRELVEDEAMIVQAAALSTLVSDPPSPALTRKVAQLIVDGIIRPFNFFMAFQVVAALPARELAPVVRYLDDHPDTESGLRDVLRTLRLSQTRRTTQPKDDTAP